MSVEERDRAWLRLRVLQLLEADAGYDMHEYRLQELLEEFGLRPGGDRLRAQLAWLAEQGLVGLREIGGGRLARLTARGADAARGAVRVPGVGRPRP